MALGFSVGQSKIEKSDEVSAALKNCPQLNRLRATIKKTMQELKFLLLKFNGAAVTSISLDLDPDNYVIKTLLNMDEHRDLAENVGSSKKLTIKGEARETENPS